jgi:hypothetical protein
VPALIAIEVVMQETEGMRWVPSMLDACNAALEAGACVYSQERVRPIRKRAIVSWLTPTHATIAYTDEQASRTLTRTLEFGLEDAPEEKWRVVGFTTALLAGEKSTEPRHQDASAVVKPAPKFPVALTARLLGSSGLAQKPPKFGGQLRIDARAWQAPWLLGLSGEYTTTAWKAPGTNGDANWSELGLGAAILWYPAKDLELFTRVDALMQRLTMSGNKKAERDDVQLWQPGLRLALDLHWPLYPHWYAVFGAHASVVRTPVVLRVDGKPTEEVPPVAGGLNIGLQFRF